MLSDGRFKGFLRAVYVMNCQVEHRALRLRYKYELCAGAETSNGVGA